MPGVYTFLWRYVTKKRSALALAGWFFRGSHGGFGGAGGRVEPYQAVLRRLSMGLSKCS